MVVNPNRVVWLDRGHFPAYIGFVPNKKAWRRILKWLDIDEELDMNQDDASARCWNFQRPEKHVILVTIADKLDGRDFIDLSALLIHEATHVMQFLMENIGEAQPSREFEAYTMQNIAGGLIHAYRDTRMTKKERRKALIK